MIRIVAFLAVCACAPGGSVRGPGDDSAADGDTDTDGDSDADSDGDTDVDTDVPSPHPSRVALPYVEIGEAAPSSPLDGSAASRVTGPFAFDGGDVVFTGSTSDPGVYTGTVTWSDDARETGLAAVVGSDALGDAVWTEGDYGVQQALVNLPSAPNADGSTSWSDDTVLIAVSPSFSDHGVPVITHLHGHGATVEDTVAVQALVEQYAISGRDAVFVAPQGPVEASSGDFGQLMDPDGHRRLVEDAIAVLYRDGFVSWPLVGDQVLTSHSGGYYATAAIVRGGGLPIDAVHLYDSVYGERATFADFADTGGILRSDYTEWGGTVGQNELLYDDLVDLGVDVSAGGDAEDLAAHAATVTASPTVHDACMRDELVAARWLDASGLPVGAGATPTIRSAIAVGTEARVSWVPDGDPAARAIVEGGDGATWTALTTVDTSSALVAAHPRYRVRFVRDGRTTAPSDELPFVVGTGRWLVVDGFTRVLDGSWHEPRHGFAADVGLAAGVPVDAASDVAVARGDVDLSGYVGVIWLLGDESSADVTLDPRSEDALEAFVDGGGRLILSGSEVGYGGDRAWLTAALGASYASDDAGTTTLDNGWAFGVAYEEDWPDVLTGGTAVWRYSTGGAAAVRTGRVVVVGFPLETLAPAIRATAVQTLVDATAP